jgi:hypothetical protein
VVLIILGLGAVLFLVACILVLPPIFVREWSDNELDAVPQEDRPQLKNDRTRLRNEIRTTLLQAFGGALVLIGVYLTWRQIQDNQLALQRNLENTQNQIRISQEGEITDRLTKAVDQLGSEDVVVRTAAVYELERIVKDSKSDRKAVIEILAALVRTRASTRTTRPPTQGILQPLLRDYAPDVQAAVTVLGRRALHGEPIPTSWAYDNVSLVTTNLKGADLRHAHLEGVSLVGSNLEQADLRSASLKKAQLQQTVFKGALLQDADLEGALLNSANLEGAFLDGVHLIGARADKETKWPLGFDPKAAGVIIEG